MLIINGLTGRLKPKTNLRYFTIATAFENKKEVTSLKGKKILVEGLEANPLLNINNTILSLRGIFNKDIFIANSVQDISLDSTTNDLLELSKILDFNLSISEYQELKQKLEKISIRELLESYRAVDFLDFTDKENLLLEKILTKTTANSDFNQTQRYFESVNSGLDYTHIAEIYNALRNRAKANNTFVVEIIKKNPYILTQVMPQYNNALLLANQIADVEGMTSISKRTHECASHIIDIILENQRRGSAFMWRNQFFAKIFSRGKPNFTADEIFKTLDLLTRDANYKRTFGSLTITGNEELKDVARETGWPISRGKEVEPENLRAIYLTSTFMAERYSVENMDFIKTAPKWEDKEKWDNIIDKLPMLDFGQKTFLKLVPRNRITLLTGGPGAGKTQAIRHLLELMRNIYGETPTVIAPTALAAFRASAETSIAREDTTHTIHRYAKIFAEEEDLIVNLDTPIEVTTDTKLLIIDEASMITPFMWRKILMTITPETNIVVAGDSNQLPPVGVGGIFPGLLRLADQNIANIAKIELQNYYRGDLDIKEAMTEVLKGNRLPLSDNIKEIEAEGSSEMLNTLIETIEEMPEGTNLEDILILTPYRSNRSDVNIRSLNNHLQRHFNPTGQKLKNNFKVGDLVVATCNDYKEIHHYKRRFLQGLRLEERPEIYNGTFGKIIGVDKEIVTIMYNMAGSVIEAKYRAEELPYYIELAYATTVHKAQGGQAKHVILIMPAKARTRALLYTAISRCMAGGTITVINRPDFWKHKAVEEKILTQFYQLALQRFEGFAPVKPRDYGRVFEGFELEVNFL